MNADEHNEWRSNGEPVPTSAVRTNSGECAYEDCENDADYLVKAENVEGSTAKTRVCQTCSDEHRIWAEDYLPPEVGPSSTETDHSK